jgi:polysaccharide biosynthesis transport protein
MRSDFLGDSRYPVKRDGRASRPIYAEIVSNPETDPTKSSVLGYWETLYRNKGKILMLAILGAGLGYAFILPQTPIYRARTSLEVLEVNNSFLGIRNLEPTVEDSPMNTRLHTEMRMLQSTSLIQQVREKLLQSDAPLIKSEDRLSTLISKTGLPPLRSAPTRLSAIQMAASTLQVRNPDLTRMVEITCESTDPRVAAEFTNTLIQTYMEKSVEGRLTNVERTREWLDNQIQDVKTMLERSNAKLVEYAQGAGLTLGSEATDKLKDLQEQLSAANAALIEKAVEYESAQAGGLDGVLESQADQELTTLSRSLVEKNTELAKLRTAFAPGHYQVVRLVTQIEDLQQRVKAAKGKVLARVAVEYEKAKLRQQMQAKAYDEQSNIVTDQSRKMIQHNMLQREVETYRQLYDSMLQRVKESVIASAMRANNVRVVDKAEMAKSPYKPEPTRSVLTGFSTGLFLGILLVFVRNSSDRRLRTPGEAAAYLNVRELGFIPSASAIASSRRSLLRRGRSPEVESLNGQSKNGSHTNGARNSEHSVELTGWAMNTSPKADSFRSTLVSLLSGKGDQKSLVVTSPNARDGKTSIVSNLGIALNEIGQRVLLIDGDLRRPRLHKIFELPNTWGLTDHIGSDMPLDRYPLEALARPTRIPDLYVLPSGPGTGNIAKLLYSPRTRLLIARLQEEFDFILIDTPPMLQYPDARVLAMIAGSAVVVLRAGHTNRETGKRAVDRLADDGVNIIGAILNDFDPKSAGDEYGRDYLSSYDYA